MSEERANKDQGLLDSEELLHLAMAAINAGQHPQAMAMLKQALKQDPNNGLVTYLLAAEYAQVGMFDRAMEGMEAALKKAPDLEMARLQLGLLYTARDRLGEARPLFERLESLPLEDALHWFGAGLLALLDEQVQTCREALQKGMQLNRGNPSLNADMQRILTQLDQHSTTGQASNVKTDVSTNKTEKSASPQAANSLFLSRYGKDDD